MEARELHGAWNFRDVADATDILRPGRLFRSSELSRLDDEGRDALHRLGVTDIADLRSPREVARRGPGRVPADVDIHLLSFPDLAADQAGPDGESPHEHAFRRIMTEKPDDESVADAATRYMTDEYRRFPTLGGSLRAVQRVVALLAAGRPVLAHCFAGKDRTGFVVAVVLEAAGADRDAIAADYLCSNTAISPLRARIMEIIQQGSDAEITPE
ncbi:MAG: tyrosine-protein phosphatase, partial [Mycobacterium sp.]